MLTIIMFLHKYLQTPILIKTTKLQDTDLKKPWISEELKDEILKKHKLYQKAKKSNDASDWEAFKEHRNKVTAKVRAAKLEFIGNHPEKDIDKIMEEVNAQTTE